MAVDGRCRSVGHNNNIGIKRYVGECGDWGIGVKT